MSSKINIRNAEASDYQGFCRLVTEVDEIHTGREPEYFKNPPVPGRKLEYFTSFLEQQDKAIFMAELDSRVAGFIQVSTQSTTVLDILVPQSYAHVNDLVVSQPMWRKGVGAALMQKAELWAKEKGLKELRLNVRSWNEGAIRLYESAGLKSVMHNMIKQLN